LPAFSEQTVDRGFIDQVAQHGDLPVHGQMRGGSAVVQWEMRDKTAQGVANRGRVLHRPSKKTKGGDRCRLSDPQAEHGAGRAGDAQANQSAEGCKQDRIVAVAGQARIKAHLRYDRVGIDAQVPENGDDLGSHRTRVFVLSSIAPKHLADLNGVVP
jgi:hypothetical protein